MILHYKKFYENILQPKLQGKTFEWCQDSNSFYLNKSFFLNEVSIFSFNNNRRSVSAYDRSVWRLACKVAKEKWFGETWHGGQREWGHTHYLNEPSLYELLVSGKKAMIDLREDHLSRCVRSRGRRSEVREGWRRMKSQRRKKKEEEEGKCKKKQILLERPVFMNSGPAPSQMEWWEKSTLFQHRGGLLRKSGLIFWSQGP